MAIVLSNLNIWYFEENWRKELVQMIIIVGEDSFKMTYMVMIDRG